MIHSLRILSFVAVLIFTTSAHAANSTWSGTTSSSWSTAGNWSGGTPTSATTAQFSTTYATQPELGANASVGGIWATTGLGQDATIGGTGTLTIAGNLSAAAGPGGLANTGILLDDSANHNLTINVSGTTTNATSFVVNNSGTLTYAGSLYLNGNILTLGGNNSAGSTTISGVLVSTGGGLTINTAGTVNLTNTDLYSGATTVTKGTLNLTNSSATAALSTVTATGGTLNIKDSTASTVTRFNNLTLNGGTVTVTGTSAGTTVDTITGSVTLNASTFSTLTVNPNAGSSATLAAGTLTHSAGSSSANPGGILFVNGTNLGSSGAGSGKITFTTAPAFVGSQEASVPENDTAAGIIPYLVGEVSTTQGGGGTATGVPNTFVTYDPTTGLRPLDLANEYAQNVITSGVSDNNNIRITTGTTTSATNNMAINSLLMNGGNVAISGSNVLVINSGALFFTSTGTITGGTLSFSGGVSAGNSYAGNLMVNGGGLNATVGSQVGIVGAGAAFNIYVGSGSTLMMTGGMLNLTGGNNGLADIYGGGTIILNGGNYSSSVNGFGGNININTPGTILNFTGSSSFYSGINLSAAAGTVVDLNSTGSAGSMTGLGGGGTIKLSQNNVSIGTGSGVTISSTTLVTGGRGVTFNGSSGVTFNAQTTYAGGTSITGVGAQNVTISGGNALSDTGFVLISDPSGTLTLGSTSETIGTLNGTSGGAVITNTSGTPTLTINTAVVGNGSYQGMIKGTGLAVTKKGIGTETLAGTNTYTGVTTVNNGTLALDFSQYANVSGTTGTTANFIPTTNTLTLGGGTFSVLGRQNASASSGLSWTGTTTSSTVTLGGSFTTAGMVAGQALSGTNITAGTYIVYISGSKTLVVSTNPTGTAAFDLGAAANSVTSSQTLGNLTLTANTGSGIVLNSNGGLGTNLTLGNTWTRGAGATLNVDLSSPNTTLTSNPSASLTNGIISFATVKDAAGIGFATSNSGTIVRYTGATVGLPTSGSSATTNYSTSGSVTLTSSESVNSLALDSSAGNVVLNLGGTTLSGTGTSALGLLQTGSNNAVIQNGQIGASNTELIVQQYGTGSLTLSGTVSGGTGSLTKTGTGKLILTGTNTYSGATTINGGVLNFSNMGNLGTGTTINFGGGTLQYASGNTADITASGRTTALAGAGGTIDTNGNNVTYSGVLSGVGGLGKTGSGTLTLSGNNTYAGDTTINQGTLLLDLSTNTTGVISSNSALIATGGILNVQGKNSGASSQTLGGLAVNSGGNKVVVNSNGGSGVTLTINNTWTRAAGATLNFDLSSSSNNVLQSQSVSNTNGIIGGWATLTDSTGTGFAYYTDAVAANVTNPIARYTGATTLANNSNSAGANFTTSSGSLALTNGNHFMNTLAIDTSSNSVALTLGSTSTLSGTVTNTPAFGILQTGGNNATITGGQVGASGAELIVNQYSTGNLTISGTVSGGNGSLTKTGPGTLTLSGTNAYSGATIINGGSLILSSSLPSSSVTVNNGGSLGGTGTIGGSVAVLGGGSIGLQNGTVGTLTIGSLTIGDSSSPSALTFDIGSTAGSVDSIAVGNLTFGGIGGTTITIGNATGVSSLVNGTYNLITYTGTLSGAISNLTLLTTTLDGKSLSLATSMSGSLVLTVSNAPATSTTYTLTANAGATVLHAGGTTSVTNTITNTGTGTADSLNYTGLGVTTSSGTLNDTPSSGGPVVNNGGTGTNTGTFTAGSTGTTVVVGPTVSSVTGTTSTASLSGTTNASIVVYTGQGVWNTAGSGSWGTASATQTAWTAAGGTPGLDAGFTNTDSATFGTVSGNNSATVSLNGSNPSLNAITFSTSGGGYTLAQGSSGSFTLSNSGSLSAAITDSGTNSASNTISAPIVLASNLNATITDASDTLTISGTVSGSKSVTKNGAGKLILSGNNTYTNGTTVNTGTLVVGTSTTVTGSTIQSGAVGTGTLTLASGSTLQDNGTAITLANAVSASGTITFSSTGAGSLTFDGRNLTSPSVFTLTGNTILIVNNTTTIDDNIAGNFTLTKQGNGTLNLLGTSSSTAGTTITSGSITIANGASLGSGLISLANGTGLTYTGGAGTLNQNITVASGATGTVSNTGTATLTLAGTLTKADANLILNAGGHTIDVTGAIVSTGATGTFDSDLYVTNGTTIADNSNNSYSGPTHIYGNGTLVNGFNNALPTSTVIELGNSGGAATETGASYTNIYQLNGHNQSIAGLTSANPAGFTDSNHVIGGSATLSTLTLTGTASLGEGILGGTGSNANNLAVKFNPGSGKTITLSGSNTYTGGTEVVDGNLLVNNTTGSATGGGTFKLDSGAGLSGTGTITSTSNTINGNVTVGSGGTNTTDVLTMTASGTTTFSGANLTFNLDANSTNSNVMALGSTPSIYFGNGVTTLTLNLLGTGTTNIASGTDYILFTASSASDYKDLTFSGSKITNFVLTLTGTASNGAANSLYYGQSYLILSGNNIEIQVVPEPGTWALMLGGLALLVAFQRVRRSRNS